MSASEKERLTRAAGVAGLATLLSRILGFVRDMVTAYFFGAGLAADAFFVAFRIPNLLRSLVAEGALTIAFVPVFTDHLTKRSREEAFALVQATLTVLSLVLVGLSLAGVLLSPWIVRLFAPGFLADPEKFALTVLLNRIMFPYIFFVGLMALAMGILNALGRFAAPALSPVMLNLGMIGAMYFLRSYFHPPVLALAVGVMIGGLLQVMLQLPDLFREKGLLGLSLNFRHPGLANILRLMGPAAFGAAVYQVTVFINTLLASFLPQGSVSALYYADRLVQFPRGVFAIAVASAVLPSMSRQASAEDMAGLTDTLSYALRLVVFITLPAMVGLIVLAGPIFQLLFERGHFDAWATKTSAEALVAYSVGLCAFSGLQIVVRAFYALKDTKTPVYAGVAALLVNVVVAVSLMGWLRHIGLALASSISATANLAILVFLLRRRLGRMDGRRIGSSSLRSGAAALGMGLVVLAVRLVAGPGGGFTVLGLEVLGGALLGTVVYLLLAWWWRSPELRFLSSLRRRGPGVS
jgi:putative peptidoglycan lipid II flippase